NCIFCRCLYYKLLYRFESISSTLSVSKDSLSTSSPLKLFPSCSTSFCTRAFNLLGRYFSSNISYLQFFFSFIFFSIVSLTIFFFFFLFFAFILCCFFCT